MSLLDKLIAKLQKVPPQKYVNVIIVGIGLTADLISLGLFFGAINTPVTGSNFYVNSREFLAWVLFAIIYSVGLLNAYLRRRWRKLYGDIRADHSIFNLFAKIDTTTYGPDKEQAHIKFRNFQRDFSSLYVVMFPVTFLYSRAITATQHATGVTSSPWGDISLSAFFAFPITVTMMVISSMFDFALSIFVGDSMPENIHQ
jgi:hypothetical protein